jgi:DNA-binding beta-propeller fold protein YncE
VKSGRGNGKFLSPFGQVVAPDGTVYVTDGSNQRVQAFCVT